MHAVNVAVTTLVLVVVLVDVWSNNSIDFISFYDVHHSLLESNDLRDILLIVLQDKIGQLRKMQLATTDLLVRSAR